MIRDNTITNKCVSPASASASIVTDPFRYSDQALRIKTKASATDATVTNITYSGNTGTGLRQFGVLIDQVRSVQSFANPEMVTEILVPACTELPRHPGQARNWRPALRTSHPSFIRVSLSVDGVHRSLLLAPQDVNFVGDTNTLSVNSDAMRVAVNCGSGSCAGTWDWSALKVTGGSAGPITNFNGIKNFSQ